VYRVTFKIPTANPAWTGASPDPASATAPYRVYNIGNNRPVELMHFIRVIEEKLGKKAELNMMPMQPGDVPATEANIDDLIRDVGFKPATTVETGVGRFIEWYREYYRV
jgi:UDP-glucuronate 4-epimerase